ncbi:MAG: hydrogenase expression/formation protein HypE, partial [Bacteroidota bacterium]
MAKQILLEHGSGGKLSHELVRDMFLNKFPNPSTVKDTDAALLDLNQQGVGFTTDSYVVDPIFFPGGDIGRLAVSGTVNDLLVSGYRPRYLSASFIIEEGFPMQDLEKIVDSMVEEAKKAGISIVTGDTKVVDKGKCDKLFINTTGVGEAHFHLSLPLLPSQLSPGDVILINGHLGDHGIAVMAAREGLKANGLVSDVAPLNDVILPLLDRGIQIKFMRDATRG